MFVVLAPTEVMELEVPGPGVWEGSGVADKAPLVGEEVGEEVVEEVGEQDGREQNMKLIVYLREDALIYYFTTCRPSRRPGRR